MKDGMAARAGGWAVADPGPLRDPLGHRLLARRVAAGPALVQAMLDLPLPRWPKAARDHPWIVTGVGSSETHARLLAAEVARLGGPAADFVPLAAFFDDPAGRCVRGRFLVVISQGLSPNCRPALAVADCAAGAALFTAATVRGAREAGHADRAQALEDWLAAGRTIFPLIPENEYAVLLRVLGPLAGVVAVLRAAAAVTRGRAATPDAIVEAVASAGRRLIPAARRWPATPSASPLLVAGPELASVGQNLAYKFLEGLFVQQPAMVDWIQLVHGAYQQRRFAPGPVIALREADTHSTEAWQRALPLLRRCAQPLVVHQATLPFPWSLLEHEAALNGLVLALMRRHATNQRLWPGHAEDGPLYNWQGAAPA